MNNYIIVRKLTDDEYAELADKLMLTNSDGTLRIADVAPPVPVAQPPSSSTLPGIPNLLHGDVPYGDVVLTWNSGVPQAAEIEGHPESRVAVPQQFWAQVVATVPQDWWAPFAYIAYLESNYVEGAVHDDDNESSYGVMQVNRDAWPQYSVEELQTYRGNLHAAVAIMQLQGYGAWYNSSKRLGLI